MSPVMEVQSPNHGTARAIPGKGLFLPLFFQLWKLGLREVTYLRLPPGKGSGYLELSSLTSESAQIIVCSDAHVRRIPQCLCQVCTEGVGSHICAGAESLIRPLRISWCELCDPPESISPGGTRTKNRAGQK